MCMLKLFAFVSLLSICTAPSQLTQPKLKDLPPINAVAFSHKNIHLNINGKNVHRKIDRALVKLIVDWGTIENYHPVLYSNRIDADSLFCIFSNDIIINNGTYSSKDLLDFLNKTHIKSSSGDQKLIYSPSLILRQGRIIVQGKPKDTGITNKRIFFNDSTEQLVFNNPQKASQPFPNTANRILAIEEIWNNYRFYYPYQDILPNKNSYKKLLLKYVKSVQTCKNAIEYNQVISKLTAEYRDSHSKSASFITKNNFGAKSIAVKVRHLYGKVIITDFYDDITSNTFNLKIGDQIQSINGESILDIFHRLKPFIAYSNKASYYRDLSNYSIRTNQDSLRVQFIRDGISQLLTLPTYNLQDLLIRENLTLKNKSLVKLNDSTLYIHCKYIDTLNLKKELSEDTQLKYFIFDLRSGTTWIMPIIENFFIQKETAFASYSKPNPTSPGDFTDYKHLIIRPWNSTPKIHSPKVFILVNENTQSQGEFQAMFLQVIPNAKTIGSKTAGTDGNTSTFKIPGNINITMTSIGIQYPNGLTTRKKGVHLDIRLSKRTEFLNRRIDLPLILTINLIKKRGL